MVGSGIDFVAFARDPKVFRLGDYVRNLDTFFRHFDRSQVLVVLMEDLRRDLSGTVRRVCRHIGVDPLFDFDLSSRSNTTGYLRVPALIPAVDGVVRWAYPRLSRRRQALLRVRRRWLFSPRAAKPHLDPAARAEVAALTGRAWSGWRA